MHTPLENLAGRAAIAPLLNETATVIGYGAQGQSHAMNLRDSGVQVIVASRPGGRGERLAREAGFDPAPISTAVRAARLVILGLPDEATPVVFDREVLPHLRPGQALGFMHGFNIHYRRISPPPWIDVVLVAPKGQGRAVRSEYLAGRGVAALVAVHQDASGKAMELALAWAAGIGAQRTAIFHTTFRDETETDLFGEQAVLCGGMTALIKAAFETLVEAGYPPELAYFECCHEVRLIADLVYERGITAMRERISNTARFGDLTRGPRVVDEHVRGELRRILAEIRDGRFADEWARENEAGRPRFESLTDFDRGHAIEAVGARIRAMLGLGE